MKRATTTVLLLAAITGFAGDKDIVVIPSVSSRSRASSVQVQVEELFSCVSSPRGLDTLPSRVVAKDGDLTLFADYVGGRSNGVALYLVNRTSASVRFESEDGDIYVKLEYKGSDGIWARAQTHQYSWCGNSYMDTPDLRPGKYFCFLGYSPPEGEIVEVRYRRYAGDVDLVSNIGKGRVNKDIVRLAEADALAVNTGDLNFVTSIAMGAHGTVSRKDAIIALGHKRFHEDDVRPVLILLSKSDNQDIVRYADFVLKSLDKQD
jgi:hypothetical protein